jgi:pilus assembly protein CpaE
MQSVARIVLAVDSEHLAQDVIDFLDRTGRATVVDAVRDPAAVAAVVEREKPDAVIGSPSLVPAGSLNGSAFLAVAAEESIRALRQAVDAGARGFFVWPAERAELLAAAARTAHATIEGGGARGSVIAVLGARGGAGATFLATHLAAAIARRGKETIVVDGDASFGDLTWALGVPEGAAVRTLADLDPVRDEISREHLQNVLWDHPGGMRVLLAPPTGEPAPDVERQLGAIEVCASMADSVVVHLPRSLDRVVRRVAEAATRVLVVVSLDVMAFRDAKRLLGAIEEAGRWDVVVNRAGRGLIVPADVERVFGRPALAVVPSDRRVPIAQDRGELVPARSRTGRALDRLASLVLEETA